MSKFLTPLILRALSPEELIAQKSTVQLYELNSDFSYQSDLLNATITSPKGLVTNFASVPRFVWSWMDPEDPVILFGSVIHDALYTKGCVVDTGKTFTRLQADQTLIEAMGVLGASRLDRTLVYWGLRIGGSSHWQTS
jgi:hypothetical protein